MRKNIIRITATVQHLEKAESFYRVSFHDLYGKKSTILIPRESFSAPATVCDLLLKAHADIPTDRKTAIKIIAEAEKNRNDRKIRITSRTGWREGDFVFPSKTYGQNNDEVIFDKRQLVDAPFGRRKGKLKKWRRGLRKPCLLSDYLLFGIAAAFGGPLLHLIGEDEGAVFHLHGLIPKVSPKGKKTKSSSGKSLTARATASTIGRCGKKDLVTFAMSTRGIEDLCVAHNDLIAVFDEEGRSDRVGTASRISAGNMAYIVPSGRGTFLSNKATRDPDLKNQVWTLFGLSTGENPLDDVSGSLRQEGAQVRMIAIPVPAGHEGGIFNRVIGSTSEISRTCKILAQKVEDTITRNYGVAMRAYLRRLVPNSTVVTSRIPKIVDDFVREVGGDTDPWDRRFATKFGIVLAGAILAAEYNVAPWTAKRARRALTEVYAQARTSLLSVDMVVETFCRKLKRLAKNSQRFPLVKKGAKLPKVGGKQAFGVLRDLPGHGRCLLIRRSGLKRWMHTTAMAHAVLKTLADQEILVKDSKGKLTRQIMLGGLSSKKRRYICLRLEGL